MFGVTKKKEAEARIQELEQIQAEYQTFFEEVKNTKTTAEEMFQAVTEDCAQLEQEIHAAKESTEAGRTDAGQILQKAEKNKDNLNEMAGLLGQLFQIRQEHSDRQTELQKHRELLEEIDELSDKVLQEEKEISDGQKNAVEHAMGITEKMQESAGNLSVLALQAGIEAGRLGGLGREFLEAAENMRKTAEEYCSMLQELSEQMKRLERPENQTGTIDILKVKAERAAQMVTHWEESGETTWDTEKELWSDLKERMQNEQDAVKEVHQKLSGSEDTWNKVWHQLQEIHEGKRKVPDAKTELERQLSAIYEKKI